MTTLTKHILLLTLLSLLAFTHLVWGQSRPTNEERLIRVEEGVKNLDKRFDDLRYDLNKRFESIDKRFESIDKRFESIDKRFDKLEADLKGFMYWGFGILFSGMFILVGFILWDRRTTLAPVVKEIKYNQAEIDEWKKKEKTIIEVLNKYAELDPKLKEILNKAALL